jgi:hypothetical protein
MERINIENQGISARLAERYSRNPNHVSHHTKSDSPLIYHNHSLKKLPKLNQKNILTEHN